MGVDLCCGLHCVADGFCIPGVFEVPDPPDTGHFQGIAGQDQGAAKYGVVSAPAGLGPGQLSLRIDTSQGPFIAYYAIGVTGNENKQEMCGRFFFLIEQFPDVDYQLGGLFQNTSSPLRLTFLAASRKVQVNLNGLQGAQVSVELNRWYMYEWKANWAVSPNTVTSQLTDWQTGVVTNFGAMNGASVITTLHAVVVGNPFSAAGRSILHFANLALSWSQADYPLGPGITRPIAMGRDGTHVITTAGNLKINNTTNIDGTETTLWQIIKDYLFASKGGNDRISQGVIAAGDYVEFRPAADIGNASWGDARNITVVAGFMSETADASLNAVSLKLVSGASVDTLLTNSSVETTSGNQRKDCGKGYRTLPDGSSLAKANLEALRIRFGFATDVAPIPHLHGVLIEAEYPISMQDVAADTIVSAGGWLDETGAAPTVGKLTDASDVTLVKSVVNPSADTLKVGFADPGVPGPGPWFIGVRQKKDV